MRRIPDYCHLSCCFFGFVFCCFFFNWGIPSSTIMIFSSQTKNMNLISWNVKCSGEMARLAAETEITLSDTDQSPSSGLTTSTSFWVPERKILMHFVCILFEILVKCQMLGLFSLYICKKSCQRQERFGKREGVYRTCSEGLCRANWLLWYIGLGGKWGNRREKMRN